jgi:hypothetical protein
MAADGEEEFVGAAPQSDPAGFAVACAHQEAAEAGQVTIEVADGDDRDLAQGPQHLQPDFANRTAEHIFSPQTTTPGPSTPAGTSSCGGLSSH